MLGLTCHIEFVAQAHYCSSIEPDDALSPRWQDVFPFHWRDESQPAVLDEPELIREDARLHIRQRDAAVADPIDLIGGVDARLVQKAAAETES